jgi:RNA polymerase sigma factor (sigma-70 family)
MDELELADRFDRQRPHLRAVAYRILGSLTDADDAVQEAWLRLRRTDAELIDSLERWLTTVVARICLNMLRSRRTRGERPLDGLRPEPIIDDPAAGTDPEHKALLADSVGKAMQVVLDTLTPAERLAFVLHDMFAVPFGEIASMVDRSPEATRQLASRARRRVREAAPPPDPDLTRQRAVVDAYFAAAREGTSRRWWRCSTPTSCSAPTAATATRSSYAAPSESRVERWQHASSRHTYARRSSTAPPPWSRSTASGPSRCWRSLSSMTAR